MLVPTLVPPIPQSKPRTRTITQGAVSLPRKNKEFRDQARRRGSYHDGFTKLTNTDAGSELAGNQNSELVIKAEERVSQ